MRVYLWLAVFLLVPAVSAQTYPRRPEDPLYEQQRLKYEESLRQQPPGMRSNPITTQNLPQPEPSPKISPTAQTVAEENTTSEPLRKRNYVTLGGGAAFASTLRESGSSPVPPFVRDGVQAVGDASNTLSPIAGYEFGIALGKRFTDNFLGEVEFSYFNSPAGTLGISGGGTGFPVSGGPSFPVVIFGSAPVKGTIQNYALMFNGILELGTRPGIVPYVGAGIGYNLYTNTDLSVDGERVASAYTQSTFAYQLRAGLGLSLSDSTDLLLGYRYFGTTAINSPDLGVLSGQQISEVELKVRFAF